MTFSQQRNEKDTLMNAVFPRYTYSRMHDHHVHFHRLQWEFSSQCIHLLQLTCWLSRLDVDKMNWYLSEIHPEPTNNTRGRGKTLDSTRKSRESLVSEAHEGRGRLFFFFFLIVTFQINNFLKWFKNTCHSWTTLYMGSHCFKGNLCHYVSNEVTYWSQLSVKSDLMRLFFTRFLVCKLMSTYMYKSIRSKTKMKLNLITYLQFTCFFNSHVIFSFTLTGCGGNF